MFINIPVLGSTSNAPSGIGTPASVICCVMFKITPCSNSSLSRLDNFCPYAPVLSVPSGLYIVEGVGADKTVPISIRSEISRGPPSSRVSSAAAPPPGPLMFISPNSSKSILGKTSCKVVGIGVFPALTNSTFIPSITAGAARNQSDVCKVSPDNPLTAVYASPTTGANIVTMFIIGSKKSNALSSKSFVRVP